MKRLAIAMMIAALTLSVVAQRAGSHSGFSGHSVSAPHAFAPGGGFGARAPIGLHPSPGPRGFAPGAPIGVRPTSGYPGFAPRTPIGIRPAAPRSFIHPAVPYRFGSAATRTRIPYTRPSPEHIRGPVHGPVDGRGHDGGHDGDRHHHHRGVYWGGYVYPYYPWFYGGPIFTGYVDPWLFGPDDYYGYGYGYGDAAPYRDYGMQSSQPYPAEYYQGNPALPAQESAPEPSYQPQPEAAAPAPSATASTQRAVTLIFNDGRPPVQIHNYLLTGSTLTVLDPQYREIPLNSLNLAATQQANRAAGGDFRIPVKQ